jgi:hypothetical protein
MRTARIQRYPDSPLSIRDVFFYSSVVWPTLGNGFVSARPMEGLKGLRAFCGEKRSYDPAVLTSAPQSNTHLVRY